MAKAIIKETPKPGNDVYTGLLALSLVAMIIGCVLLALDLGTYDPRTPPPLPRLEVPGALKQQPSPATPRVAPETKEIEATPPADPAKEAPKEGARLPSVKPDFVLPKLIPDVVAAKPEPAMLPKLPETKNDPNVKPAVAYEIVPELKPATAKPQAPQGDDPPVLVKPFVPN